MNIITHNLTALNAQNQLKLSSDAKVRPAEKLSSGYRINRAADDAAGLKISEKMRFQIRGLDKGSHNIEDGRSMLETADGALEEVQKILIRIQELATQAANDTNTAEDRAAIQNEIDHLRTEINRIGNDTEFNKEKVLQREMDRPVDAGFDTNAFKATIQVTGSPVDTSILNYVLTADADNGIRINGTNIPWSSITNANNNDLSGTIEAGTYSFDYNGLTMSFTVNGECTIENIVDGVNGVNFRTRNSGVIGAALKTRASWPHGVNASIWENMDYDGHCTVTADETGFIVTNQTTGASVSVAWSDASPAGASYEELFESSDPTGLELVIPDTPYSITLNMSEGWEKSDVINALDGASYDTAWTETTCQTYNSFTWRKYFGLIDSKTVTYCSKDFCRQFCPDDTALKFPSTWKRTIYGTFRQDPNDAYNLELVFEKMEQV